MDIEKKLVIVCEDDEKDYARFLIQLISLTDDEDEKIIGVKDGTVKAAIFSTKQYKESEAKISSSQYVLFLGKNKTIKKNIPFIPVKYDKYGMKYGWLGKRAFLLVEKTISKKEELDEFINYCKEYKEQLYINSDEFKSGEMANAETAGAVFGGASLQAVLGVFNPLLLLGAAGTAIAGTVESANAIKNSRKMRDLQYHAVSSVFYLEGLREFLEG